MTETARRPILVGYDGSPQSRDALALATAIAGTSNAPLLLGWVEPVGPMDLPYDAILAPVQDRAEDALHDVAEELRRGGLDVATHVGLFGSAARGLQELAENESAAFVVVGSSHRGRIGRVFAGTVAARLLQGAPCPIAVATRGLAADPGWSPVSIGLAYNGTSEARAALEQARALAVMTGGRVHVISVAETLAAPHLIAEPEALERVAREQAQGWLDEAGALLGTDVAVEPELGHGQPAMVLERASEHLDILVVGSRGYGPIRRVLLGSVATHIVAHSHCPVIVTPRSASGGAEADGANPTRELIGTEPR